MMIKADVPQHIENILRYYEKMVLDTPWMRELGMLSA